MTLNLLVAWVSTVGFAIVFNIPRRDLLFAGFCGASGWAAYLWAEGLLDSVIFSSFLGALTVALLGEVLSRFRKQPVTVYVIPGIIPLVPGYGLYRAMESIIRKDIGAAADIGFETLLVAVAIASGIIIASSFGKLAQERQKMRKTEGGR